jgi:PAS domain S-box-containing protein
MANMLPQIVWETDINGMLTFTNINALISLGYSQAEFDKGINVLSLIIPQDKPRAIKNIQGIYAGAKSKGEEFTALRKDGSTYPVQVFTSPIIENGVPVGIRGISKTSARQNSREQIKGKRGTLQNHYEAFPDILMIIDLNEKIVFANCIFEKILGITPEEYNTPSCRARIHPDDRIVMKQH